ncbi:Anaphase-promoting complex subunit 10 [Venturia nashicola]|nr:Anaphase-promoting complex subunit 10 [Venturia nashicola]
MSRPYPLQDSQSPELSEEEENEDEPQLGDDEEQNEEDEEEGEEDGVLQDITSTISLGIVVPSANEAAGLSDRACLPPPPPSGLKEISSLASWTVSSSKPGCGIPALRSPSTSQFWQSDGPQPHHLNIHFFKLVEIVGIRIYLDFDLDESYTPTLVKFAAGTGYVDLQEFAVMRFEQPKGWMSVDFEGVGDPAEDPCVTDENEEEIDMDEEEEKENSLRKMPVLRCMLVQVRICENHQNGKDTHLRGLQIFARDGVRRERKIEMGMGMEKKSFGMRMGLITDETSRKPKKKVWELEMPGWSAVEQLR